MITVLRCNNKTVGVYVDDKLVYTQSKVQKDYNLCLEREIKNRGEDLDSVKEITGDYSHVSELPRELKAQKQTSNDTGVNVTGAKDSEPKDSGAKATQSK